MTLLNDYTWILRILYFGSSVLNYCHNKGSLIRVKNLGIQDKFIEHATRNELLDSVNLNESSIINSIEDFLEE